MTWQAGGLLCACGLLAVWLAFKNGTKSAQIKALKAELHKRLEEQQRAQQITDRVFTLSTDDVRKRLHRVAHK